MDRKYTLKETIKRPIKELLQGFVTRDTLFELHEVSDLNILLLTRCVYPDIQLENKTDTSPLQGCN